MLLKSKTQNLDFDWDAMIGFNAKNVTETPFAPHLGSTTSVYTWATKTSVFI